MLFFGFNCADFGIFADYFYSLHFAHFANK